MFDGAHYWVGGAGGTARRRSAGVWSTSLGPAEGWPLLAAWGDENGDVWTVGYRGAGFFFGEQSGWHSIDVGSTRDLAAIGGRSSTDVWATTIQDTVHRFDGDQWQQVGTHPGGSVLWVGEEAVIAGGCSGLVKFVGDTSLPLVLPPELALSCTGWNPILVGPHEDALWLLQSSTSSNEPHIVHFDGASWQEHDLPPTPSPVQSIAHDGTDLWMVDMTGDVMRHNGSTWIGMASPRPPSWGAILGPLYHVRALAPDDVYVFGAGGYVAQYDGEGWENISPGIVGMQGILDLAVTDHTIWAVGMSGLAVRRDR